MTIAPYQLGFSATHQGQGCFIVVGENLVQLIGELPFGSSHRSESQPASKVNEEVANH